MILFAAFCLLMLKIPFSLSSISEKVNATHTFYTTQNISLKNANSIKSGNGFLISTSSNNACIVKSTLNENYIQGESFCFDGTQDDITKILHSLNATIVKKEKFDGFTVLYAHSPKITNYIILNNKKVNIQIAYKNKIITVGTPIILGSY